MPKIAVKTKKLAVVVSVFIAVALSVVGFLVLGVGAVDDLVFAGFVIAAAPYAVLDYIDYKWRKNVDAQLPELFRSIVQAQDTGMTLPQALETASKREYGPLTGELKKMTNQISWGASFEESLLSFGKRVGTVLTLRTVPMIIEASRSGGHVEKVFDPMGKFIQTTLLLEKERKNQTKPYIAIIYIALFVFLFTIAILFKTFFTGVDGLSLFSTSEDNLFNIKQTFLHLTLIQGFFGGLVAGKMGEGHISSGVKHSILMMLMGYLTIRFFL